MADTGELNWNRREFVRGAAAGAALAAAPAMVLAAAGKFVPQRLDGIQGSPS